MGSNGTSEHYFRIAHALHLLEVLKTWNVGEQELLAGTGLTGAALADPRAKLSVPMMIALLERARLLSGDPAIGLRIGLHTRATLYGHLGFAVVSASTIRKRSTSRFASGLS